MGIPSVVGGRRRLPWRAERAPHGRWVVVNAYLRVPLGIEVLAADARIVVSSVDAYLQFAEATNRLDLWDKGGEGLPDILTRATGEVVETVATSVAEHTVDGKLDRVGETLGEPAEKAARAVGGKAIEAAEHLAAKTSR